VRTANQYFGANDGRNSRPDVARAGQRQVRHRRTRESDPTPINPTLVLTDLFANWFSLGIGRVVPAI